jgi:hypothetical protein
MRYLSDGQFCSSFKKGGWMAMGSFLTKTVILGIALAVIGAQAAEARDDAMVMSVTDAMNAPAAKEKLDGSVAFYFGKSAHPAVLKKIGTYVSNKKTNSLGKSDVEACNWAMLSALITFQERAQSEGGNAVINLVSYYKKNEKSYDSDFECHAGAFVTGVALKGDVVKLKK